MFKRIRFKLEVWAARLGRAIVSRLPRRAVLRLARILGRVGYHASPSLRRLGLANLRLAFGQTLSEPELRGLLRESFASFALVLLDLFWFSRDTARRLDQWMVYEPGMRDFFVPRAQICITGHLGNWEVVGRATAHKGFPLASVYMPVKNPEIDRRLRQEREITGQLTIEREGALKALIQTLRQGGKIALLLDQNTPLSEGGVFVDFFGCPATMSPAAASLALKTGTELIVGFSIPHASGHYHVHIVGLIQPGEFAARPKAEALQLLNQKVADLYEASIRRWPGNWLWMYKRWKFIRPGDDPARYPFYARTTRSPIEAPVEHVGRNP